MLYFRVIDGFIDAFDGICGFSTNQIQLEGKLAIVGLELIEWNRLDDGVLIIKVKEGRS